MIKLSYEKVEVKGESPVSTTLIAGMTKEEHEKFRAMYKATPVTEAVVNVLLAELNSKLMPNDDQSNGWEIREAGRHGYIKALQRAINLLP
jgi:hypothetical protein